MQFSPKQNSFTSKRLQIVDIVRGIAVLIVVAHHLGCYYISKPSQLSFFSHLWFQMMINGAFGVTIFFVVSGFVITRLIASEPGGLFKPDFKKFYARRVGRISPLLILVCLIGITIISLFPEPSLAFQFILKDPNTPMTPAFWISIATFSFNWYQIFSTHLHEKNPIGLQWGLLWTLAIEEQFYLFYPFALKQLRNERNLTVFLITLIIFGPIMGNWFGYFFPNHLCLEKNTFGNLGFLAIGCLLYLASTRYRDFLLKNKKTCVRFCLFGFFLFGFFYWHHYVSVDYWWFFWGPPFLTAWASTFLTVGVFFFLLGGLYLNFFNSKHWSILAWIGKLSYGGYLYNSFFLYLLWPFFTGKNEWLDFFILSAVTFGWAELSYRYFEVPANLWIRKILGRSKNQLAQ